MIRGGGGGGGNSHTQDFSERRSSTIMSWYPQPIIPLRSYSLVPLSPRSVFSFWLKNYNELHWLFTKRLASYCATIYFEKELYANGQPVLLWKEIASKKTGKAGMKPILFHSSTKCKSWPVKQKLIVCLISVQVD